MSTTESATFAAGCFWGVEASFRTIPGVQDAEVGYTGGHTPAPTYEAVCRKDTGHAEAVRLVFDPATVSYESLVRTFFELHNPTQRNRQGPDTGSQYRSAIFVHDEQQRQTAQRIIEELGASGRFPAPIVTEVVDAAPWHRAEDYHQQYLAKRGRASCRI